MDKAIFNQKLLVHYNLFVTLILRSKPKATLAKQHVVSKQECLGYIEKWP